MKNFDGMRYKQTNNLPLRLKLIHQKTSMHASHKFLRDIDHLGVDNTDIRHTDNDIDRWHPGRRTSGGDCDDECLEFLGVGTVVIGLIAAACECHR